MTLFRFFSSAMLHRLFVIWLLAVSLPSADALQIHVNPGMVIDDVIAPPGQSIVVEGIGPLTLTGTLQAGHGVSGQNGGRIVISIDGIIIFQDGARLLAGDGGDGEARHGWGRIDGADGGDGGSIVVQATGTSGTLRVRPGDGGDGGSAYATGTPGEAVGGDGGDTGRLETRWPFIFLTAPSAGEGGDAEAHGKDACSALAGRDDAVRTQNATTGDAQHARAQGGDGGCVHAGEDGAPGGNATAIGGNGGHAENGNGGKGGNATAIGGRGGDARDLCFQTTEAAEASGFTNAGDGGVGGTPTAIGGNGGTGLIGGRGGDAYARSAGGDGGNATIPILVGTGGMNQRPGGGVHGGDGGFGIINGGSGGQAIGTGKSGDGGSLCGPLPSKGIPPASVSWLIVGVLVAGATMRRRFCH